MDRNLYANVSPVDKIITKIIKFPLLCLKDCSKIESLEKKPVIKGIPHNEMLVQEKTKANTGLESLKELANRPSCELFKLWIMNPAAINNVDLNKACIIKWRKANSSLPSPKITNINPSWLSVDKAITFLRSVSKLATQPAASIVIRPIVKATEGRVVIFIIGINRIMIKTPAVTRVEECTKAETGVGAAIAAGSHAEKGIWALLVKELIRIIRRIIKSNFSRQVKL